MPFLELSRTSDFKTSIMSLICRLQPSIPDFLFFSISDVSLFAMVPSGNLGLRVQESYQLLSSDCSKLGFRQDLPRHCMFTRVHVTYVE